MKLVEVSSEVILGNHMSMVLFGGLNVIEDRDSTLNAALEFRRVCSNLEIPLVFKASFDKANRSSIRSYRGVGLERGLEILREVKSELDVPIVTDIHEREQVAQVSEVADVLQIPAFLARQTDLVIEAAETGKALNVKKPQFMSPTQVAHIVEKIRDAGNERSILCERGVSFGYDNLVVDMLGFAEMARATGGSPVIFDVTHSLQQRDPSGHASGGRRNQLLPLARAGVAAGVAGIFLEAHPDPDSALCDGPSALPMALLEPVLAQLSALDRLVKAQEVVRID